MTSSPCNLLISRMIENMRDKQKQKDDNDSSEQTSSEGDITILEERLSPLPASSTKKPSSSSSSSSSKSDNSSRAPKPSTSKAASALCSPPASNSNSSSQMQPTIAQALAKSEKKATKVKKADCPVCGRQVPEAHMNTHLDHCLAVKEEKSATNSKPRSKLRR